MISPAPLVDQAVLVRYCRLGALFDQLHAAQLDGAAWMLHSPWCTGEASNPEARALVIALVRPAGWTGALGRPIVGADVEDVLRRASLRASIGSGGQP